jgi:hypothetical protein
VRYSDSRPLLPTAEARKMMPRDVDVTTRAADRVTRAYADLTDRTTFSASLSPGRCERWLRLDQFTRASLTAQKPHDHFKSSGVHLLGAGNRFTCFGSADRFPSLNSRKRRTSTSMVMRQEGTLMQQAKSFTCIFIQFSS